MSDTLKQVVNMDNLQTKRRFMQKVQTMSGLWEISMKPRKLTRSLSQNAYYWAAVVAPFTEWLRAEWGESDVQPEQAHELLKTKILGTRELVNKQTGEAIEITRSSKRLDTHEFGEFIENAAAWLAEFTGIVVLPSEMFYEEKQKNVLKYKPKSELRQQLEGSLELLKNKRSSQ
jgi:hypothetical protein